MEILSITKRKARKEHKCDWCLLIIKKGETYSTQAIADEGSIRTWKNHEHCGLIADKIGMFDGGDGVSQDEFYEYIKEEYSNIMSENFNDVYESKDFKLPNFEVRLNFVLDFHKISR